MSFLKKNNLTLVAMLFGVATWPMASLGGPQWPPAGVETPLVSGAPESWEGGVQISTYSTVNLVNGNVYTEIPVISWSGRGPDIDFRLYHNSTGGVWRFSYSRRLISSIFDIKSYIRDDGRKITFTLDGNGIWQPQAGYYLKLEKPNPAVDEWVITTKDQWQMVFDETTGDLLKIRDSAGNELTVSGPSTDRTITDAAGRTLTIVQDLASPLIWVITDPQIGRSWQLRFADGTTDRLDKFTDAMGNIIDVTYAIGSGGKIGTITDKHKLLGSANTYSYVYNNSRLQTVTDPQPFGYTQTFVFDSIVNSDLDVDPGDPPPDWKARTQYTNRRGTTAIYQYWQYPGDDFVLRDFSDSQKWTRYWRDPGYNQTKQVNPSGAVWQWAYDSRGNMQTFSDPVGNRREWIYDAYNNITFGKEWVDYAGNPGNPIIWEYRYEDPLDRTNLTRIILPAVEGEPEAQRQVTLTYYQSGNSKGQLDTVTDANGVESRFTYDSKGQLRWEDEGTTGRWRVRTEYTFDIASRLTLMERDGIDTGAAPPPQESGSPLGANYDNGNRLVSMSCQYLDCAPCPSSSPAVSGSGCPDFRRILGRIEEILYDPMDHPTEARTVLNDELTLENSDPYYHLTWDDVGRLTYFDTHSPEPTWHESGLNVVRWISYDYSAWQSLGEIRRSTSSGLKTVVGHDNLGRVQDVTVSDVSAQATVFSASYTYHDGRDLVQFVHYGNGIVVEYGFDAANRLTLIQHGQAGQDPFLKLDYSTYDGRNLITRIIETDENLQQSTIAFEYDTRGRLVEESRVGTYGYNLRYAYDQGDNRICKVDLTGGTCTMYTYDITTRRILSPWPTV
ncbi:MAG: hypothetical protein V3W34_19725 [Phycisphaerae bacterium]